MLTPRFYTKTKDMLELYAQLNSAMVQDVVRVLAPTKGIRTMDEWRAAKMDQAAQVYDQMIVRVGYYTDLSSQEVRKLLTDAGIVSTRADSAIYKAAGFSPTALQSSPRLLQILEANIMKTNGVLNNLTLTTALSEQQAFISAVNYAAVKVETGVADYVSAIRDAILDVAQEGTRVLYPSGHSEQLDSAARRSILTSIGQTTAQLALNQAEEVGSDLVEVTAHVGARPSHAEWQGKVYSISGTNRRYEHFAPATGYGTGGGLCGYNCRHSFFPYFENLSVSAYPKEVLQEYEEATVYYNGEHIPFYEATQIQRGMEADIRTTKRKLGAVDVGIEESDYTPIERSLTDEQAALSRKLAEQEERLHTYLDKTGLYRYYDREEVLYR